jgi:hypothetical protein
MVGELKIYQIHYDEVTKQSLDALFIPFDNSNTSHADWFEYSAIREILKSQSFDESEYIGILSPKFFSKTGLTRTVKASGF